MSESDQLRAIRAAVIAIIRHSPERTNILGELQDRFDAELARGWVPGSSPGAATGFAAALRDLLESARNT